MCPLTPPPPPPPPIQTGTVMHCVRCTALPCAALRCHALHYAAMRCTAVQVPRAALHRTQCAALHCTCTPPHRVAHATLDRCIDPAAVCSHPPSWSPLLMGAWTPGIERSPQSAAAPLFAQQTNNCNKLCPMDVAVTSVRRLDRLHRFADPGQACPCRLSICLLLGCAGHS
jgi:hypothetical protein